MDGIATHRRTMWVCSHWLIYLPLGRVAERVKAVRRLKLRGNIGPMISNYIVDGMTCDHCVRAVTEEVGAVPGVEHAEVVLDGGALTVTSQQPIAFDQIAAAVDEAGDYTVAAA